MQSLHNRTFLDLAAAGDSASVDSLSLSVDVSSESAVSSSSRLARFCFGADADDALRFLPAGALAPARLPLPPFAGGSSENCTPGNLAFRGRVTYVYAYHMH